MKKILIDVMISAILGLGLVFWQAPFFSTGLYMAITTVIFGLLMALIPSVVLVVGSFRWQWD